MTTFISSVLLTSLSASCNSVEDYSVKTKRVLFTGDSITEGKLGCSYLDLLKDKFPDWEMVNLGQDGDTVSGIMGRTIKHLKGERKYDLIVISAGHNDIILPDFAEKDYMHRIVADTMKRKGSVPAADYDDFISTYTSFIASVKALAGVPVALITLSCLNEDLTASTNIKRAEYNSGISKLAAEYDLILADVASVFNNRLSKLECRDYFMNDFIRSALFDRRDSKTDAKADRLSDERRLNLTIDGIHMNSEGAGIYSQVLIETLNKV